MDFRPHSYGVSVLIEAGEHLVEFPFSTFVQAKAERIVGEESVKTFGTYFPIRFNYDDTYHSNGNMSVQCHPDGELCRSMYGEHGSQDEAYYVVATAHRAKTFIGFNEGIDPHEFIEAARSSQETGEDVDYEHYVNHIDSVPGRQVMIPGGTIHASGRGQLILELGSLTMARIPIRCTTITALMPMARPAPFTSPWVRRRSSSSATPRG